MIKIFRALVFACLLMCISKPLLAQYFSQNSLNRASYLNFLKYQKTKNEGGNLKKWWKGETTIGAAFPGPVSYTERSHYDSIPGITQESYDTVISSKASALFSLHLNSNSNHLIARLGSSSILSLSIGVQVDYLRWKLESFDGNTQETATSSLVYLRYGAPVTLDYKWGCDVDFDKDQKTCFAVGAGGMPVVGMAVSGLENAAVNFRVAPYLYASFGFYGWGCWKIRASYMPGNYSIIKDAQSNYGGTINTLNIKGNHIFAIGISHMSYSNDWGKGNAWRGSNGGGGGGRRRHRTYENSRMF